MNKITLITTLIACILSGCAPYRAAIPGGSFNTWLGYHNQRIDKNRYLVEYYGNGFSSDDSVLKKFHRRSSELCPSGYQSDVSVIRKEESRFEDFRCVVNQCRNWLVASGEVVCNTNEAG